jgi:hypothetical protein
MALHNGDVRRDAVLAVLTGRTIFRQEVTVPPAADRLHPAPRKTGADDPPWIV